jgi:3-isopropylmalate/(R)-2-methylmalate dehydratase small subunit
VDPFTVHTGRAVPLRRSDVDTDQIFPGRFGRNATSRTGYAKALFGNWRDQEPDFVLNQPAYSGADVLVTGADFATGSSREYAVWALQDYGFKAVLSPRFGDIFRGNAPKRGLLPVVLDQEVIEQLWTMVEQDPTTLITVDLVERRVTAPGVSVTFEIDDDTRHRLLNGLDDIAVTERYLDAVDEFEARRHRGFPTTLSHA